MKAIVRKQLKTVAGDILMMGNWIDEWVDGKASDGPTESDLQEVYERYRGIVRKLAQDRHANAALTGGEAVPSNGVVGTARPQQMPIKHTGMEVTMKTSREIRAEMAQLQTLLEATERTEAAEGRDKLAMLAAGERVPMRIETKDVSIGAFDGPNAEMTMRPAGAVINGGIRLLDGTEIVRFAM